MTILQIVHGLSVFLWRTVIRLLRATSSASIYNETQVEARCQQLSILDFGIFYSLLCYFA